MKEATTINRVTNMVTVPLKDYNELRDAAKECELRLEKQKDSYCKRILEIQERTDKQIEYINKLRDLLVTKNKELEVQILELSRPIEDRYEEAKRELKSAKLKCRLTRGMLFLHEMVSMARHEFAKSKKKDPKTYDYNFPWND